MNGCVAVINAGSSSIKCAVYDAGSQQDLMFRGQVEQIDIAPSMRFTDAGGGEVAAHSWDAAGFDHRAATQEILRTVIKLIKGKHVTAVGHRVVHGGTKFAAPVRVDPAVMATLESLVPLAPLHQPHNLAAIAAITEVAPGMPQVTCFDTAFHQSQAPLAQQFALPRKLSEAGIRRYGFHGLSYEYVASRLNDLAPDLATARVIIAHLGNGASLCAVHGGRSVATTMGFTAVDGLIMGTRCGAIDPGVLIYLMDAQGMDARAIEKLVYKESGLLGVSGISSDMRTLRASSEPAAREAIDLFIYRIVREIGSLTAALGGLDALVFTGGIGEKDIATRAEVAAGCGWLGARLDEARNKAGPGQISTASSSLPVWVIPTDEERMIARHTVDVLGQG